MSSTAGDFEIEREKAAAPASRRRRNCTSETTVSMPTQSDLGLQKEDNISSSMPMWYHQHSCRATAEEDLAEQSVGTFLVRKVGKSSNIGGDLATHAHAYSLSIRVPKDARWAGTTVKHYQIQRHKPTGWFELANSLTKRPQFPTLQALILAFGTLPPSRTDGVRLASPCRPIAIDEPDYTELVDSPPNKLALELARQATDTRVLFQAVTQALQARQFTPTGSTPSSRRNSVAVDTAAEMSFL
jgi:hypothetical protein